jgi:predicted aspartyl protease
MFLVALCALLSPAAPPPAPRPPAAPSVATLEATADPASGDDQAKDHLPLAALPDDRLTVEVRVGGEGPFRFLVDTGSDRTAVSSQLAERLALPRASGVRMHSVTGTSRVRTASVRGLSVAQRALPDVTAPLLDSAHVRADGILGTDVLRSALVRFDFRDNLLSIGSPRKSTGRSSGDEIVVEGHRRSGRLIVTEASVDGHRVTVVLDTGSEVTIGNRALLKALGRRAAAGGQVVELTSVTGAKLPATYTSLSELEIGRLRVSGLGIAFADAHTFKVMGLQKRPALLLGMNALKAFDSVTIDLGARKLRFALPSGSAAPPARRAS